MANIGLFNVTDNWQLVTDVIGNGFSFDSDANYLIEARGQGGVILQTAASLPEASDRSGVRLDGLSHKVVKYKLDTDGSLLYVRLDWNSAQSGINVTQLTEE